MQNVKCDICVLLHIYITCTVGLYRKLLLSKANLPDKFLGLSLFYLMMAMGLTWGLGRCNSGRASVHWAYALPTELLWHPRLGSCWSIVPEDRNAATMCLNIPFLKTCLPMGVEMGASTSATYTTWALGLIRFWHWRKDAYLLILKLKSRYWKCKQTIVLTWDSLSEHNIHPTVLQTFYLKPIISLTLWHSWKVRG